MEKIRRLVRGGRVTEALALAREAVATSGENPEAWTTLAHVLGKVGDAEGALSALDQAVRVAPGEPGVWFDRGRLLLKLGSNAEALTDFRHVRQFERGDYYKETAVFLSATALVRLGRHEEALKMLANVRDDMALVVGEPLSKRALLEQCERAGWITRNDGALRAKKRLIGKGGVAGAEFDRLNGRPTED